VPDLGVPELIIVAVIVLLLFGPGKAADLGGSLGKSIREFRKASREETDDARPPALHAPSEAPDEQPRVASGGRFCTECGTAIAGDAQKFCTSCGASTATLTAAR
jgi:sec-independent protein translocase protein TatA